MNEWGVDCTSLDGPLNRTVERRREPTPHPSIVMVDRYCFSAFSSTGLPTSGLESPASDSATKPLS
jgi:hypothetical protein